MAHLQPRQPGQPRLKPSRKSKPQAISPAPSMISSSWISIPAVRASRISWCTSTRRMSWLRSTRRHTELMGSQAGGSALTSRARRATTATRRLYLLRRMGVCYQISTFRYIRVTQMLWVVSASLCLSPITSQATLSTNQLSVPFLCRESDCGCRRQCVPFPATVGFFSALASTLGLQATTDWSPWLVGGQVYLLSNSPYILLYKLTVYSRFYTMYTYILTNSPYTLLYKPRLGATQRYGTVACLIAQPVLFGSSPSLLCVGPGIWCRRGGRSRPSR